MSFFGFLAKLQALGRQLIAAASVVIKVCLVIVAAIGTLVKALGA
jgi:hypothetical protein